MTERKNQIPPTINGYEWAEVVSAIQKSIRRGWEEDAVYWASELDRSGYGQHCWKRLLIITTEDIGTAEPNLPATIRALYDNWRDFKKAKAAGEPEKMFLIHAVVLLARAKKSRSVDNATITAYLEQMPYREVPDVAKDKHTMAGARMGRGFQHFIDEGSHLENKCPDTPDPWEESAKTILLRRKSSKQDAPVRDLTRASSVSPERAPEPERKQADLFQNE
jgi:replication-associated recombination protein RarA